MATSPVDLISSTDSALCLIIRGLEIRGRGRLFAHSQNIDFPESFSLPYFTRS